MPYIKALTINLVLLAVFLVVVLLLLRVDSWFGLPDYRSTPASVIGWFFAVSGLVLRFWALSAFSGNYENDIGNARRFVTSGPYARTRNPLEAGAVLIAFGFAVALGSYLSLILPILSFFILNAWIKSKEKELEAAQGTRFLEYKNSVPRWWRGI